jgi:hypothetical protein
MKPGEEFGMSRAKCFLAYDQLAHVNMTWQQIPRQI